MRSRVTVYVVMYLIRNNKVVWLKIGKFRVDGKREAI